MSDLSDYQRSELDGLKPPSGEYERYRIKVTSGSTETKWLTISPETFAAVYAAIVTNTHPDD